MAAEETDLARQFIGAWSLISWTARSTDGTIQHPFGRQPMGQLIYAAEGRMAACLMRRQRTKFASENRLEASPAEREAAYRDYLSYFGSFTIDVTDGTVTHHVEGATFPNWCGTELTRAFSFAAGRLTLSLVRPDGAVHDLVWERIRNSDRTTITVG